MRHISECLHNCEQEKHGLDLFSRLHQNYLEDIAKENDDLENISLSHFSCPDFDFGEKEEKTLN